MMARVAAGQECHHPDDPKDEHCHMDDKYGYGRMGIDPSSGHASVVTFRSHFTYHGGHSNDNNL